MTGGFHRPANRSEDRQHARISAIALGTLLSLVVAIPAGAQTYRVLHNFSASADENPYAGLIPGSDGNFHGTTTGGRGEWGTVFKLDREGNETVLHYFDGGFDGIQPYGGLVRDDSDNLYGATNGGGEAYDGILFKIDPAGDESILYTFTGKDGAYPYGGLIRDAAGNLYGTTAWGGGMTGCTHSGCGTVFEWEAATGTVRVLHSFVGGADGSQPWAALVMDDKGDLYGTTPYGGSKTACSGSGCGTIFQVNTAGKETVLYAFKGGTDGEYPYAGLLRDSASNLYGTAEAGGNSSCVGGCGIVFKLEATGLKTTLHSFTGPDGVNPYGGLVRDAAGNLYGTTHGGGAFGLGTVFELSPTGQETVLHSFDENDGEEPYGGLIFDTEGNLYGTTYYGGVHGSGVAFRLTP